MNKLFMTIVSISVLSGMAINAGFNPETPVNTPHGLRPIGALAVGDKVICMNKRFEPKEKTVKTVEDTDSDTLVEITTHTGTVLQVSPNQQMYIATKRTWVPAYELALGDILITQDKKPVRVKNIRLVENKTKLRFITVDKHENFAAGKDGIVAHNGAGTGLAIYGVTKAICYGIAVASAASAVVATGGIVGAATGAVAAGATLSAAPAATVVGGAIAGAGCATEAALATTAVVTSAGGSLAAAATAIEGVSMTVAYWASLIPFLP